MNSLMVLNYLFFSVCVNTKILDLAAVCLGKYIMTHILHKYLKLVVSKIPMIAL